MLVCRALSKQIKSHTTVNNYILIADILVTGVITDKCHSVTSALCSNSDKVGKCLLFFLLFFFMFVVYDSTFNYDSLADR